MASTQQPSSLSLHHIISRLPKHVPISPQLPNATLTPLISSLQLHPSIEALLHLLNSDLASAHFLCRHMQAPPAVEGMLLHAMLHRVEGDYDNARAWLGDVGRDRKDLDESQNSEDDGQNEGQGSEPMVSDSTAVKIRKSTGREGQGRGVSLLRHVYGSMPFLTETGDRASREPLHAASDLIAAVETFRTRNGGDEEALKQELRHEARQLLDWCVCAFGDGRWEDATSAWARPEEKVRKIGEEMVSGGRGWREF